MTHTGFGPQATLAKGGHQPAGRNATRCLAVAEGYDEAGCSVSRWVIGERVEAAVDSAVFRQ